MGYLTDYHVAGYECDRESLLSIRSIFNWLQDSMDRFSRSIGIGYDFCEKHNLTYILKNYDVQIQNLPHWTDSVQMETAPLTTSNACLFFAHTLKNKETKAELFHTTSQVVLLNTLNGHPARVKDCLPIDVLKTIQIQPNFQHLPPINRVDIEQMQPVSTDHIDFNQHINNTNYVVFAERTLSPEFLKKAKLQRIQAAYKQAAKLGDSLRIQTQIAPGFTDHQIVSATNPDINFARIRFHWAKRDR